VQRRLGWVLWVSLAASFFGFVGLSDASTASGTGVVVVSTVADTVNGDVSSVSALVARPGVDGISLREAITAADKTPGRHAITFAPGLAGRTITPSGVMPALTRDDTSVVGLMTSDGQPAVTLDGSSSGGGGLLAVNASGVTISHLRFVGLHNQPAVAVHAGVPAGELAVHDVSIESDAFTNSGGFGVGIWIGTDFPGNLPRTSRTVLYPGAVGASLTNITIAHNVIQGFTDDGINVGLPGTDCSIHGLVIEDNTIADNTGAGSPALELDTNFTGNSIVGTQILRNTFTGNWAGIHLNGTVGGFKAADGSAAPSTGNTVAGTIISQNVFSGNKQAIAFNGGAGSSSATGNAVVDTAISDDVFANNAPFGAIGILGGGGGAGSNRIDGVSIVNDTIAGNQGGISLIDNSDSSAGNRISGVTIENTIFWSNGGDLGGPDVSTVSPTVRASLMNTDPRFVGGQDFHLQAGSPAIDAATSSAPAVDIDDGLRVGAPDIGAYEFGAAPRSRLAVVVDELGGTGTVSSTPTGISCGATCDAAFNSNTTVTLAAVPAVGSRFTGWAGACTGTAPCVVALAPATTVTATFSAPTKPASKPKPKAKPAPKCKKGQKSTPKHPCRRT
jgi:hypothetical protein